MNKKLYDDGIVKIEKVEVKTAPSPKAKTLSSPATSERKINLDQLVDTAFSYGSVGLNIIENGSGRECILCGEKTSFDNRYICPSCWSKRKEEICKSLKEQLKGKTLDF